MVQLYYIKERKYITFIYLLEVLTEINRATKTQMHFWMKGLFPKIHPFERSAPIFILITPILNFSAKPTSCKSCPTGKAVREGYRVVK